MNQQKKEKKDWLQAVWAAAFGALIVYASLASGWGSFFGKAKEFGLLCLFMPGLLAILSCLRRTSCRPGKEERKRLLGLLCVMALYVLYCMLDQSCLHWGNEIRNSLVAGGAVSLAALFVKEG